MFYQLFLASVLFGSSFCLSSLKTNTSSGQTYSETKFENAINKSITYFEKLLKDSSIPGAVVGVSINGTLVWAHSFGLIDVENEVETRVDSVWRLGSISKPLTSALIGKLIDEGRVDLDKSIHEYLSPNVFPVKQWNGKNVTITVGQVMSHTAGLHLMVFPDELYKALPLNFQNVTQTLEPFKGEALHFAPGTNYNYSNYGYQVVGAIIESVLNQTYEKAINKMFEDLGMDSTFCERRERIIPRRARYYMTYNVTENKPQLINTIIADDLVSHEASWPAGGLVSTVPDLLKFGSKMIKWSKGVKDSGKVNLSAKTVHKLWSPVVDLTKSLKGLIDPKDIAKYAHGWDAFTLGHPIPCSKCKSSPIKELRSHIGGIAGVHTILIIAPDNDLVVTAFFNHVVPHEYDLIKIGLQLIRNFAE